MKRTVFVLAGCIVALLVLVFSLHASSGRQAVVTGVIIYISDDSVEIKRGNVEMVLNFADATAVVEAGGAPSDRSSLRLCQKVRATYSRQDGRNVLVRVQVLREGECFRQ